MRRTHLRGHANILKHLLVHASAFNLGLFMRTLTGIGTPRSLQGRVTAALALAVAFSAITMAGMRTSFTIGTKRREMALSGVLSAIAPRSRTGENA